MTGQAGVRVAADRGFTLIEIMIVLVVIGIAAAVVAPEISRRLSTDADRAAAQLSTVLQDVRETAVTRGRTATVALDLRTGAYVVVMGTRLGAAAPMREGTIALGPRTRLESPGLEWTRVSFDRVGRARGPSITVADGAARRVVTIDPWTADIATQRR